MNPEDPDLLRGDFDAWRGLRVHGELADGVPPQCLCTHTRSEHPLDGHCTTRVTRWFRQSLEPCPCETWDEDRMDAGSDARAARWRFAHDLMMPDERAAYLRLRYLSDDYDDVARLYDLEQAAVDEATRLVDDEDDARRAARALDRMRLSIPRPVPAGGPVVTVVDAAGLCEGCGFAVANCECAFLRDHPEVAEDLTDAS